MEDVLHGEVIRKFYHYPYGNQTREEALQHFFDTIILEEYDRLVVSLKGYEGSVRIVELPFNEDSFFISSIGIFVNKYKNFPTFASSTFLQNWKKS